MPLFRLLLMLTIAVTGCCSVKFKDEQAKLETAPGHRLYILEKKGANDFIITRQCDIYNFLTYNDTILQLNYHLKGSFAYRIKKTEAINDNRTFYLNGEWVDGSELDTTVSAATLSLEKYDNMIRGIFFRPEYNKSPDTIYMTEESSFCQYKLVELQCDKKAK